MEWEPGGLEKKEVEKMGIKKKEKKVGAEGERGGMLEDLGGGIGEELGGEMVRGKGYKAGREVLVATVEEDHIFGTRRGYPTNKRPATFRRELSDALVEVIEAWVCKGLDSCWRRGQKESRKNGAGPQTDVYLERGLHYGHGEDGRN